jgi:demethylmacrocin O-methyltransferase
MNRLTELANKYNCDKGTIAFEAHGYTEEYGKIIPETGKYDLFEIGIWHGDSLRMWHEYNPELDITGIDIDAGVLNFVTWENKNLRVNIGNAADPAYINAEFRGFKYDFIIDDGSHNYDDIVASFKALYPLLKEGGYYFIEDLHAPQAQIGKLFREMFYIYQGITAKGAVSYFKKYQILCNDKLLIIQK